MSGDPREGKGMAMNSEHWSVVIGDFKISSKQLRMHKMPL